MHKIVLILVLSLYSMTTFSQTADTILYGRAKFTTYNKFDKRPEPNVELGSFIAKKLRYPDDAMEGGIQGRSIFNSQLMRLVR